NFAQGFDPAGGPVVGRSYAGTDERDQLVGTIGDDIIDGLDGNDYLSGSYGNDTLDGGAGSDTVYGEQGNDRLSGGDGNDYVADWLGDNVLSGGEGNDSVYAGAGADQLDGGAGNDRLNGGDGDDVIVAGSGDDSVEASAGSDIVDLGEGNDSYSTWSSGNPGDFTLTTGAGSDAVQFNMLGWNGTTVGTITDFTPGEGGDFISAISPTQAWDGHSNPYGSFLRLEQSGTDTLLQVDRDGASGASTFATAFVLQNVNASDLTEANTGFSASGETAAKDFAGTAEADVFMAGYGADTLSGLEGDDQLNGAFGDDAIDGGAGNDQISGGYGHDVLEGGAGNDAISGDAGNDTLSGGDGNDRVWDYAGDNVLAGGAGDDQVSGGGGADRLDGGTGNDWLNGSTGNDVVVGGDGDDVVYASEGSDIVDLGAGNDTFQTSMQTGHVVTTGEGSDTLYFSTYSSYEYPWNGKPTTVTDFTAGAGGDVIALQDYSYSWNNEANPFVTGEARLTQVEADTQVHLNYKLALILQNVQASDLTGENFAPGFNPDGNAGSTLQKGWDMAEAAKGLALAEEPLAMEAEEGAEILATTTLEAVGAVEADATEGVVAIETGDEIISTSGFSASEEEVSAEESTHAIDAERTEVTVADEAAVADAMQVTDISVATANEDLYGLAA
ncbi:MAG TPA: calcium-binding protein, partial [Vicinamibacterales bacterium]|nr:calcium-binding protein [Vicinamibacterales bacterium]